MWILEQAILAESFVPVYKKDYPQFENDSYILTHQIRSVSKNRITKIIGTIAKTKLMEQIEAMLYNTQTTFIKKQNTDKAEQLYKTIGQLEQRLREQEEIIAKLRLAIDKK